MPQPSHLQQHFPPLGTLLGSALWQLYNHSVPETIRVPSTNQGAFLFLYWVVTEPAPKSESSGPFSQAALGTVRASSGPQEADAQMGLDTQRTIRRNAHTGKYEGCQRRLGEPKDHSAA